MTNVDQDFDVAISFLNEDLPTAKKLCEALGRSLKVFIYTEKQEELAGTDGLESFRVVFRHRARLCVILLRSKWGQTKWTRVEMQAITDRFLDEGPGFLFVVMMEKFDPPKWIPEKLVRFSLDDFGLDEAVGAIKARALEQGSDLSKPSAAFLAAQTQRRAQFGAKRDRLFRTDEGVRLAASEATRLIQLITDRAEEARTAAPDLDITFGAGQLSAVIRVPSVSVVCAYRNQIINVLEQAHLLLTEFRGQVRLPGEGGYYRVEPKELTRIDFAPELTEERGWCWVKKSGEVFTSETIADEFMSRFFALVDRQSSGKLPPLSW